uniref:Noggin 3 n=1 Tax=Sphaeramia orbicularis TaxID=375764 RepID=A0A673CIW1_9TELE
HRSGPYLCAPGPAAGGPEHLLRPVPSDHLPVPVIKEDPNPALDPGHRDLNETELRSALGAHFDARFMSVCAPEVDRTGPWTGEAQLRLRLHKDTRAADPEAPLGRRLRPGRKLRRRLRTHAQCPVVYAWTDLGNRFWPRYLKGGSCHRRRSCSVPEGMVCRPAKTTSCTILRWVCQRRGGLRCVWVQVQYPVVSECKCACPN